MSKEQTERQAGRPTADTGGGDLRFYFAGERTMLAWIRTSVSLMALGFVVARFAIFLREIVAMSAGATPSTELPSLAGADPSRLESPSLSLWIGVILIFAGVSLCAMAAREYARFRRRFVAGVPYELPSIYSALLLCIGLGLLGTLMAVYLVMLALQ